MRNDPASGVAAVLLAGGLARRMGGGDKCLQRLGGKPLLSHVIDRIAPQVEHIVLNANGDLTRFDHYDVPVISDVVEGYAGPLAGILSGLEWIQKTMPDIDWLLSVPTDAPFLPGDLVGRLRDAAEDGVDIAVASSGGRAHPVVALWPAGIAPALRHALVEKDIRKIDQFTADYSVAAVEWKTDPIDPFFNANRPEDLQKAQKFLKTD